MEHIKKLNLMMCLVCMSGYGFAQSDKSLDGGQVNVVQDYKPTLSDAIKININPTIVDSTPPTPEIKYSNINKGFSPEFKVDPIKPAKMKGEPLQKLDNNYARAGFGNYNTSLIEAHVGSGRSKKMNYAFSGKHFSSAGTIDKHGYAGFAQNMLHAGASFFIPDHVLNVKGQYHNSSIHYYGYDRDTNDVRPVFSKSENRQVYDLIDFNASLLQNTKNDEALYHEFNVGFYNYHDKLKNQENSFNMVAAIGKPIGKEIYGGRIFFNYYGNQSSPDSSQGAILTFNPFVKTSGNKWHARLGINVAVETDEGKTHFLPDISGKYNIVEGILSVYADIKGYTYRNSYRKLSEENPFILPYINFRSTTVKIDASGGLRGNIDQHLYFNLNASYKIIDSMALYVNKNFMQDNWQNAFTVIYENINIGRFYGEIGYVTENKITVATWGAFNQYTMDKQLKPWQLPILEGGVKASYNLGDKIIAGIDVFYMGTRYARIMKTERISPQTYIFKAAERKLKDYVDASLNFEYRYTKSLAGFIRLNNLASTPYNIWNNYPSQRFNGMLGINVSF